MTNITNTYFKLIILYSIFLIISVFYAFDSSANSLNKDKLQKKVPSIGYEFNDLKFTNIEYARSDFPVLPELETVFLNAFGKSYVKASYQKITLDLPREPGKKVIHVYQKLQPKNAGNVVIAHGSGGFNGFDSVNLAAHYFFSLGYNVFVPDSITGRGLLNSGKRSWNDTDRVNGMQRVADAAKTILYIKNLSKQNTSVDANVIHWYGESGYGSLGAFAMSRPGVRLFFSPENPEKLRLTSSSTLYPFCNGPSLGGDIDTPLLILTGTYDQETPSKFCLKNYSSNQSKFSKVIEIPATHGWTLGEMSRDGQSGFATKISLSHCDHSRTAEGHMIFNDGRLMKSSRYLDYDIFLKRNNCLNNGYSWVKDMHLTRFALETALEHMKKHEHLSFPPGQLSLLPKQATNFYRANKWMPLKEYPKAVCSDGSVAGYFTGPSINQSNHSKVAIIFGGSEGFAKSAAEVRSKVKKLKNKWLRTKVNGISLNGAAGDMVDKGWQVYFVPDCSVDSWTGDGVITYNSQNYPVRGRAIVSAVLADLTKKKTIKANTDLIVYGIATGISALTSNLDLFSSLIKNNIRVISDGLAFPSPIDQDFSTALKSPKIQPWIKKIFAGNPTCALKIQSCIPSLKVILKSTNKENIFFTFQQRDGRTNPRKRQISIKTLLNQFDGTSGVISTDRWVDDITPSKFITIMDGWDYNYNKPKIGRVRDAFLSWIDGNPKILVGR